MSRAHVNSRARCCARSSDFQEAQSLRLSQRICIYLLRSLRESNSFGFVIRALRRERYHEGPRQRDARKEKAFITVLC